MVEDVYEKLARKLDANPAGYPRTDTGIEVRLLEKIFSPEEAALAMDLQMMPETASQIAERTGRDPAETAEMLGMMTRKGPSSWASISFKWVPSMRNWHDCSRNTSDPGRKGRS
jgi:hypothetical protein